MILIRYYLIAILTLFSHSLFAEYNVDYWRTVVADKATQEYASTSFLYDLEPDVASCDEGLLTEAAKLRALEALNEVRSLHNLAAVEYSYYYDEQIQQSAFVQKANNILTHYPPDTADCYTSASAAGSASSNIYGGRRNTDPVEHIIGWLDDASNIATVSAVGHRRWMIDPFLAYTTYGQTIGPAALKVFNFTEESAASPLVEVDFVAFPYQKYPYTFFSDISIDKRTPWSFTVIEDKFSSRKNRQHYFANASISVTNIETGESLDITDRYTDIDGYGVANIITWSAQGWEYDTWYTVEITDISMTDGSLQDYSYEVFIDYADLIDITRPLEAGDTINDTFISGYLDSQSDEDTYSVRLAGETTFTGESQEYPPYAEYMGYFINVYNSSKQVVHSDDASFTLFLEDDIYTVEISRCSPQNYCHYNPIHYSVDITPPIIVPPVVENNIIIEDFIKRFYFNILARTAASSEINYWYGVVQDQSAGFVALAFFNSPEFIDLDLSDEAYVDILYQTLFDRVADAGGKTYWKSLLANGILRETVLYGFLLSQEFRDLAGRFEVDDLSESDYAFYQIKQFVIRFYRQALERNAELGGYGYWSDELNNQSIAAGEIARSFFFSEEFIGNAHDNSSFAAITYETILGRTPSADEINYWANELATNQRTRLDIVNFFVASPEFSQLADSYGILVE